MSARPWARSLVAGVASAVLVIGVLGGAFARGVAQADSAPVDPAHPLSPTTVSADSLPTVQIDGVAWSQAVVGDTVYVAGSFSSARPAGVAAGVQETPRHNLLAYDIRTGDLISSFAPDLNGQALVVKASPDGSRIYVGGDFTTANGKPRFRIAAFSTATGELISTFQPVVGHQVAAIAATDSTVYLGGSFGTVAGVSRLRLAAVSAADGSLLPWNPVPGPGVNRDGSTASNYAVTSMVLTDGGAKVVAAGRFGYLNGVAATGIGALDAATGATLPFAVNKLITNQGDDSAINSLSTDGTNVYGSGYDFSGPGNVEGAFAANASTGELVWMEDCHGDTYSTAPVGGALYIAGHPHVCSNIGGFPEANPRLSQYAMAFSLAASSTTVGPATVRNANFAGKPAPAILPWYPTLLSGSVTGQGQAGWSVAGNSQYVVYAGEFPAVNNLPQAGLARFAVPGLAPNKIGPDASTALTPTVSSFAAGSARVSWSTTTDRDNANLTYSVYRSGQAAPVHQTAAASEYREPAARMTFLDTGLTPGATYSYSVTASDPFGNKRTGSSTAVTVASTGSTGAAYAATVRNDGAADQWRLGEGSGATAYDYGPAAMDLTVGDGVTRGRAGALTGDADTAYEFDGTSSGLASTQTAVAGPQSFAIETFVKTTTTKGGKVVGFGNARTGTSTSYDRHLYLDRSGYLWFGVSSGGERTVRTPARINDGKWHHVVATLSGQGMGLYVDGTLVASRADTTAAASYVGYWRIGGDKTWGSNNGTWFAGQVDEVAIYPKALTAAQVTDHHKAAVTGVAPNLPPTADFTASAADLAVTVDAATARDSDGTLVSYAWDFGDGSTGAGASASHTYATAGSYPVTLTVTG
jgi:hypothetical protein